LEKDSDPLSNELDGSVFPLKVELTTFRIYPLPVKTVSGNLFPTIIRKQEQLSKLKVILTSTFSTHRSLKLVVESGVLNWECLTLPIMNRKHQSIVFIEGADLVSEVPDPGKHHCHVKAVTGINGICIAQRTSRLNNCTDACLVSEMNAVIKWKKGIAC
jgi:hypothetical protein